VFYNVEYLIVKNVTRNQIYLSFVFYQRFVL